MAPETLPSPPLPSTLHLREWPYQTMATPTCVTALNVACAREVAEAEALSRAKVEAKEASRDSAKEIKKVSAVDKVALEEALSRKSPGVLGLTGKTHTAAGRKFLQTLLKSKKEGSFELPRWEERSAYAMITYPPTIEPIVCFVCRTTVKEEEDLEEKRRDKDSKEDKGACILAPGS